METLDPNVRAENYPLIPPAILSTLEKWDSGTIAGEPGSFVQAVLKNDLKEAITRADGFSLAGIRDIVLFCTMELPAPSWGNPENYHAWLERIRRFRALALVCRWCSTTKEDGCRCSPFGERTIHDVE